MDPEKKDTPTPEEEAPNNEPTPSEESTDKADQPPADALSMTPEELEEQEKASGKKAEDEAAEEAAKKLPFFQRLFRKVNVYFLIFILLVVVAGVIAAITYFNSQKPPETPDVAGQTLTTDELKQLANSDASVGNTSQTLTIQGNAIIAGETLTRGNLNVAGNLQTGGNINAPNITVSGTANLGQTQINSLQVATNASIQGSTTLRDLSVSGTSSFGGAVTASQITVTRLIMSGNAVLEVPNHISFTGTAPSRSVNNSVLGNGGTLSLNGSDTAGSITINTGGSPNAGCFARFTFQQAYTSQPRVIVSPINAAAGNLNYYVEKNTTGFSLCTTNAAAAGQNFGFDYFITN